MSNNFVGTVLFTLGLIGAVFYAGMSIADGTAEFCIEFAIASLVAVIGWQEIGAVDQIGQSE